MQGTDLFHRHQAAGDHAVEDGKEALDFFFAVDDLDIIGRSMESRRIFEVCIRLDLPKPIGPRNAVAPARCISRAFKMIAS